MPSIKEIGEGIGDDKHLVLDITEGSTLNLDAFDVECRKLSYSLHSTKSTPNSLSSATYRPEHLSEGGWKVTGESNLKFIVLGQKMYIFSEFNMHSTFLRGLKDKKVEGQLMDAGKITLKASIVKGDDGEPKITETKRYLHGSSSSLYMQNDSAFRRDVLEPLFSASFTFEEPRWGE